MHCNARQVLLEEHSACKQYSITLERRNWHTSALMSLVDNLSSKGADVKSCQLQSAAIVRPASLLIGSQTLSSKTQKLAESLNPTTLSVFPYHIQKFKNL